MLAKDTFLSKMVDFLIKNTSDPFALSYIDIILQDISSVMSHFYGARDEEDQKEEKDQFLSMKRFLARSENQYLSIYCQKMENSLNWHEKIQEISQMKSLPLLMPSREVVASTLDFQGFEAARNLFYMERILRKSPTFVWLSEQKPTE